MESPLTAGHQEKPAQVTILDGPESKELSDFIQDMSARWLTMFSAA